MFQSCHANGKLSFLRHLKKQRINGSTSVINMKIKKKLIEKKNNIMLVLGMYMLLMVMKLFIGGIRFQNGD